MLANAVPDSVSSGRIEKVELTEQKSHVKLLHPMSDSSILDCFVVLPLTSCSPFFWLFYLLNWSCKTHFLLINQLKIFSPQLRSWSLPAKKPTRDKTKSNLPLFWRVEKEQNNSREAGQVQGLGVYCKRQVSQAELVWREFPTGLLFDCSHLFIASGSMSLSHQSRLL